MSEPPKSVWIAWNKSSEIICVSKEIAEAWAEVLRAEDASGGAVYVEEKVLYDRMPAQLKFDFRPRA